MAIVGVCHFKGGVGATSLASSLASCYARHALRVALVDVDDVNPHLTAWGSVTASYRDRVASLLREGAVEPHQLHEILFPVEGFDDRLFVIGQPQSYMEGFHFKANVLQDAPSASDFLHSLLTALRQSFDVVALDLGRSWGMSTFASLPLCDHVVLVTSDDEVSVRRTLECVSRLKCEAAGEEELALRRWCVVLNAYSGEGVDPEKLERDLNEVQLFQSAIPLYVLPFTERGKEWGAPGESFYDGSDERLVNEIRRLARQLVPFEQSPGPAASSKLLRRMRTLKSR